MNALIEYLNRWGEIAIPLAGQVLWQSSLLIVVLLALDLLLRHRVRAGFRYALWMLVLVKLVLPPSLALPTGAGYWIERPGPTSAAVPVAVAIAPPGYEIDFPAITTETTPFEPVVAEAPPTLAPQTPPPLPAPRLTRDGQLVAWWLGGVVFLLAWMLWRWRWVARLVRQSEKAPARLQALAASVCRTSCPTSNAHDGTNAQGTSEVLANAEPPNGALGSPQKRDRETRPTVAVRLTNTAMSPAVCGLFRPVILLPRKLVNRLTDEQLRTVLLHELIHLRRRDLWVNCLQTLLQIAAWWHPLLWVANARIRRVREEAVDEAVACALGDDGDAYPATLLEVAKLTFTRPLMTLGLVGILESKHALKQRIRRLLELPPLESTRLKWWHWSVVAVLALTALPMAQGQRQPATRPAIEAPKAPTLTSQSGISYDQNTDLAPRENPNPTDTIIGYEHQPSNKSWPIEAGSFIQARKYAQALQSTPSPITVDVWAVKLDRKAWAWLTNHPDTRRVAGQTNAYVFRGGSLGEWLGTQEGVEKLEGGRFSAPDHRSTVVGDFSPDRRTLEPYSQARMELTPWLDETDPSQVWLKLDSTIDWSGETWKSRKVFMPSPGGDLLGAGGWMEAFERARGYVNQQYKTDGTLVGLGDWLILGEPFDRQTIEPIFAVVVKPSLAQAAAVDVNGTEPAPTTNRAWGTLVEKVPNWPDWGMRPPSPPYSLESTNLTEFGNQMITAQTPFPDPRVNGYRSIALKPRFLLVPVEGLIRVLGGRLLADRPLIVDPNNLVALTNSLIEAGAVDHSAAPPIEFPQMSGGVFHWQVAKGEPSTATHQTITLGTNRVVFGAQLRLPAYIPDWVPLTLLARPFANEGESLHCLLSLATGEFKPAKLVKAEETIPLGASLVWASTNEVRSGFAQVVLLHNSGEPKAEDGKKTKEAAVETREEAARNKVRAASALIEGGKLDEAEALLREAAKDDPGNSMVSFHLASVERARRQLKNDRALADGPRNEGRPRIMEKLRLITLDELRFDRRPLKEVVRQLQDDSVRLDPTRQGVTFMIVNAAPATNGHDGSPPDTEPPPQDIGETIIDINPALKNLRLLDALQAVTMAADRRIKFTVEDFAVVFTPRMPEKEPLETREFRVNPNTFFQGLQGVALNMSPPIFLVSTNPPARPASEQTPVPAGEGVRFLTTTNDMSVINAVVHAYFEAAGVDLKPPKTLFYNDRKGILLVRASVEDLELIQHAVEILNYEPPQVQLEVRAVEVSNDDVRALGLDWFVNPFDPTKSTNIITGILTDPQFRVVRQAMSQRLGTEIGTQHRLTTLSGRQTQVVLTNQLVNGPPRMNLTRSEPVNPLLDLIPSVGPDGFTIQMTVIPTLVEFVSMNEPGALIDSPNKTPNSGTGERPLAASTPLPRYRMRQVASSVNLWDGQTIVQNYPLQVIVPPPYRTGAPPADTDATGNEHLLIFITPTIIDAAGNPVHKPGELPFADEPVPPPPTTP